MRYAELDLMPFGQTTIATEGPGTIPIIMTESEDLSRYKDWRIKITRMYFLVSQMLKMEIPII